MQHARQSQIAPDSIAVDPRLSEDWDLHDIVDGLTGPDLATARLCAKLVESAARQCPQVLVRYRRTLDCFVGICGDQQTRNGLTRALDLLSRPA